MFGQKFKELLMKKKAEGKVLSPDKAAKKMEVVKELMDMMDGGIADKVKGLQKVTVAAPTKEGLKEGLEKASDIMEKAPEMEEESKEDEESEEMCEEESESSPDLQSKIARLEAELAALKK